jgi:hypothetical protein
MDAGILEEAEAAIDLVETPRLLPSRGSEVPADEAAQYVEQPERPPQDKVVPPRVDDKDAKAKALLSRQLAEVRTSLTRSYEQAIEHSRHAEVVRQAEAELQRLRAENARLNGYTEASSTQADAVQGFDHRNLGGFIEEVDLDSAKTARHTAGARGGSVPRPHPPFAEGNSSPVPLPAEHLNGSVPPPKDKPPSLDWGTQSDRIPSPASASTGKATGNSTEDAPTRYGRHPGQVARKDAISTGSEDEEVLDEIVTRYASLSLPKTLEGGPPQGFSMSVPVGSTQDPPDGFPREMTVPEVPGAIDMHGHADRNASSNLGLCESPSHAGSRAKISHVSYRRSQGGFEVYETWKDWKNMNVAVMMATQSVGTYGSNPDENDESKFLSITASTDASGLKQRSKSATLKKEKCTYVIHPYSPKRALWDGASLILVVYDLIMIPFALFDPPEVMFLKFMNWVTRLFWTVDVLMSLITGATLNDGRVELRPRAIIRRYLLQWFALDIIIVGTDWGEYVLRDSLFSSDAGGYAKAGKAGRAFRIVRMLRLLRLARMREVMSLMLERIRSERVIIMAGTAKMTVLMLALAHIIACVWWGIGKSSDGVNWIEERKFVRKPLMYQYSMSMHWALSQFAGGMDEVTPANTPERVYAIFVFLTAFVAAAAFISTLTSSMTQLNIIGSQHSQQLSQMRKYLYQNGISNRLALRVMRNAQHAIQEQTRMMPEEGVTLLKHVSEPLRLELHFEMYSPILTKHPWILRYTVECPQVMRKVCHFGTSFEIVSQGDILFNAGEIPAKPVMYIVVYGQCTYCTTGMQETEVKEGAWIAEATLWTPQWMHRGVLTASSDSRLCLLDSAIFREIAGQFHHIDFDPRPYAKAFVSKLNEMENGDVTDLTFFEEIVPKSARGIYDIATRRTTGPSAAALKRANSASPPPNNTVWQRVVSVVRGSSVTNSSRGDNSERTSVP